MNNEELYFSSEKVWLAELKYYSKENNGIEYCSKPLSYAFLVDIGENKFINPFNVSENLPVFKRSPYANYTLDGESFGSKVYLANDVDTTGACYVLVKNVKDMDIKDSLIGSQELIDYMFDSGLYFKDRKKYIRDRFKGHPLKFHQFIESEDKNELRMTSYLAERCAHIRRIK